MEKLTVVLPLEDINFTTIFLWRDEVQFGLPTEDKAREFALSVAHQLSVFPVKKEIITHGESATTKYIVQTLPTRYIFLGEGVPDTCRIEYEEVDVPAQPATTRKIAKIVCPTDEVGERD